MQKETICGIQEVLNGWKEYLSDLPKEDIKKKKHTHTHTAMLRNLYRSAIHGHCK